MVRNIILSLLLLLTVSYNNLFSVKATFPHNKQIVAYYPNWQWYRRNNLVNPESIIYEKYTVINYAFFRPMSSGHIVSTDEWADENLLLGPKVWWPEEYNDYSKSLPYLAEQGGIVLLPSIGGWNDSSNFPLISADPIKREIFINDCINLIQTYNFKGIDLDWEYPGYAPHNGSENDIENFTLLVQELRFALDELEILNSQDYLLTSCFGASYSHMANIDWENIVPYLDMINLMTYDFYGSWDELSNHHTPLYPTLNGDADWCVDGAFSLLTQNFNVPTEKINIGLAFYGKALANCTQLNGSHTGYDSVNFPSDQGQPHYYTIMENISDFDYYWDDSVKSPYLLSNTLNTFVTYDDTTSIRYKAEYIMSNNAMGALIWELTGDYTESFSGSGIISETPLVDKVIETYQNWDETNIFQEDNSLPDFMFSVYPNPFKDKTNIELTLKTNTNLNISVYNIKGQLVRKISDKSLSKGNYSFSWDGKDFNNMQVSNGIYLIKLKYDSYSKILKTIRMK